MDKFPCGHVFVSLECTPGVELLVTMVNCLRTCQAVVQSSCMFSCSYWQCMSCSFFTSSLTCYPQTAGFLRINFFCAFYSTQNIFLSSSEHSFREGWWSVFTAPPFIILCVGQISEAEGERREKRVLMSCFIEKKFSSFFFLSWLCLLFSPYPVCIHSSIHPSIVFHKLLGIQKGIKETECPELMGLTFCWREGDTSKKENWNLHNNFDSGNCCEENRKQEKVMGSLK